MVDFLGAALGHHCCDIGQIPTDQKKLLLNAVRTGRLQKIRAPWAYIAGYGFTVGLKTYYCAPHVTRESLLLDMQNQNSIFQRTVQC